MAPGVELETKGPGCCQQRGHQQSHLRGDTGARAPVTQVTLAAVVLQLLKPERSRDALVTAVRKLPALVEVCFGLCGGDTHTRMSEQVGKVLRLPSNSGSYLLE